MPGTKRERSPGKWRLEVCYGTDWQGKPQRFSKTVHCKSEAQAERELALFYAEVTQGKARKPSNTTVAEFCDTYIDEYIKRFLKKSALRSAVPAMEKWIKPLLGKKKVTKVTRLDVQKFVNHLTDNGLAPKTVKNYYSYLSGMMSFAVEMNVIEHSPCENIKLPKDTKKEADFFDSEEVVQLIGALDQLPEEKSGFKAAILLSLFGGLRRAEILGLNWEDFDFDKGTVTICRTRMQAVGGGIYEDTPKTAKSNRIITLPQNVLKSVKRAHIEQNKMRLLLGNTYIDSPAMLQKPGGGPVDPRTFTKHWSRFLADNGIRHVGLHGLRHTHASMLAFMGTDKMQISSRLGHSQLSTTLNIYTHLFEEADRTVADNLDEKFFSVKQNYAKITPK